MANNLRKIALHFCEEWAAFFARLETEFLSFDFQQLTEYIYFKNPHNDATTS